MTRENTDTGGLKRITPPDPNSIKPPNVKNLALDQIKQLIASGAVVPGQRLPPERELAERLGVGRNSVREALKILEAVGLVESRVGDGTFITAQTGASIGRTIGLSLALWGGTIVEILDARRMIEVEATRAAAEKITTQELSDLETELNRMESSDDQIEVYLTADMNFHRRIGQASHNTIIAHIISDLIDLLEQVLREASAHQLPLQNESTATHRAVFEAIAQHDGAAAAEAMRRHLEFSTELWQAVISLGLAHRSQT
ncbi:MAG: FadR family transcriptional regulator [Anaerolineae bacterium]|nr:FadR family transcriptional regulator [Anaerolineae bacterium]